MESLPTLKSSSYQALKPFYRVRTCTSVCDPKVVLVCSCNDSIRCNFCRRKRRVRNKKVINRKIRAFTSIKKAGQSLNLLTLTFARTNGGLKNDLNRLHKAFVALRRRVSWKNRVSHWVAVKEVTNGNVHLHIILLSKFWQQNSISLEWKELTGNFIVDIRRVNPNGAAEKLSTYLVKDSDPETKEEMAVIRDAHKNMRFLMSSKLPASLLVYKAISKHQICVKCSCQQGYFHRFRSFDDAQEWVSYIQNKKGT